MYTVMSLIFFTGVMRSIYVSNTTAFPGKVYVITHTTHKKYA